MRYIASTLNQFLDHVLGCPTDWELLAVELAHEYCPALPNYTLTYLNSHDDNYLSVMIASTAYISNEMPIGSIAAVRAESWSVLPDHVSVKKEGAPIDATVPVTAEMLDYLNSLEPVTTEPTTLSNTDHAVFLINHKLPTGTLETTPVYGTLKQAIEYAARVQYNKPRIIRYQSFADGTIQLQELKTLHMLPPLWR